MGIIAACAPALRPLLAKILRLTSHDNYRNEGDSPSQKNGTAVRDKYRRTVCSGTGPFDGDHPYELDERALGDQDSDRASTNPGVAKVATSAFYVYNSDERSGSEEGILQGDRPVAANGILKTIDVTVQ